MRGKSLNTKPFSCGKLQLIFNGKTPGSFLSAGHFLRFTF